MSDLDSKELLQYAAECGMIELPQIRRQLQMKKREHIIKKHQYSKGYNEKKGMYYTCFPDASKKSGRKTVFRKSEKELDDLIVNYVSTNTDVTVADVFYEWLNRQRDNESISASTYRRYEATFKRHMVSDGWDAKSIGMITPLEWIDRIEDQIGKYKLTSKGLSALMLIVRPILKRAKRKGLIDYGVSDVTDCIEKKPFKRYRSDKSQVFSEEEFELLKTYLCEHRTVQTLSILFLMLSGVRVGELVTLKFEDFLSDTCAEIKRTETCYKGEDGLYHYEVKESPKTEAGRRKVFVPTEYGWIMRELRRMIPFAEYICTDADGKRMTAQNIRSKMYRVCEKIGIEKKSPHKARKTFASIILDSGADNNTVTAIMGHTDIRCTENHYHYDRKSDAKKQAMLDNIRELRTIV